MKQVRVAKKYGEWYYEKEFDCDMEFPMFKLYDAEGRFVNSFAYYDDMVYYIKTGIVI